MRTTQDYIIAAPLATHWRRASCQEAQCTKLANGFAILADESTPDGQRRAVYIRHDKTRSATEHNGYEPLNIPVGVTVFVFAPGNTCFTEHQVPVGRPELYVVRSPGLTKTSHVRRHTSVDAWVNDAAEHTEKIIKKIT